MLIHSQNQKGSKRNESSVLLVNTTLTFLLPILFDSLPALKNTWKHHIGTKKAASIHSMS